MTPNLEQKPTMPLTIQLPPEVEKKLRDYAAQNGLDPDAYARKLIEQGLNGGPEAPPASRAAAAPPAGRTLDEILAPFRREVEESGLTDDELRDFFTEVRDEVRAEKRTKRAQGKTPG